MKIAFLPARMGGFFGPFVDALSGFGGYSHAELVFRDGTCLSSTYGAGVTLGDRDLTGWLVVDLPFVPYETERAIREWAKGEVGSGYDALGVARFVLPFLRQSPDRWFCSEIVVAALQLAGFFPGVKAWTVSPNRLRRMAGELRAGA